MKINKNEFLKNLKIVKNILDSKSIVDYQEHFIFTDDKIIGFKDDVLIIQPFINDLNCSISAKKLFGVLEKINSEEILVKKTPKSLRIKSKNTVGELNVQDNEEILEIIESTNIDQTKKFYKLPSNFIEGIELCRFATSSNMLEPYLTTIKIQGNEIIGSDDFRISRFVLDKNMKHDFLIPSYVVKYLIKLDIVSYSYNKSWIFFITGENTIIAIRCMNYDYPEVGKHFDFEGEIITLPKETIKLIEKTTVIIEKDSVLDEEIEIILKKGFIYCKTENQNDWIKSKIKTNTNYKEEIRFTINPNFLMRILKETNQMIYSKEKVKFVIDDKFEHLIAI